MADPEGCSDCREFGNWSLRSLSVQRPRNLGERLRDSGGLARPAPLPRWAGFRCPLCTIFAATAPARTSLAERRRHQPRSRGIFCALGPLGPQNRAGRSASAVRSVSTGSRSRRTLLPGRSRLERARLGPEKPAVAGALGGSRLRKIRSAAILEPDRMRGSNRSPCC